MEGDSFVALALVRPLANAVVNASLEALVAVLVGPLVTFAQFGTYAGLGGGRVGILGRQIVVGTNDWGKQQKKAEGEGIVPVE